jgi:HSP20 family protein
MASGQDIDMGKLPPAPARSSTFSAETWRVRRDDGDGSGASPDGDASLRLHVEIGRLFDEASDHLRQQRRPDATVWAAPRIDVTETEREIRVRAEVPARAESDVAVALDGRVLTIRGAGAPAAGGEASGAGGSFARSIQVPWRIEPNTVTIDFQDGVLTVALPKPASGSGTGHERKAR